VRQGVGFDASQRIRRQMGFNIHDDGVSLTLTTSDLDVDVAVQLVVAAGTGDYAGDAHTMTLSLRSERDLWMSQ
jgi:hypothetical protein